MKRKFKTFIPLVLILTMLVGQSAFAMGEVTSFFGGFFADKLLNQYSITHYYDATTTEQKIFIKEVLPTLMKKLDFPLPVCNYSMLDTEYRKVMNVVKNNYDTWDDMYADWDNALKEIDKKFIRKYNIEPSFFGKSDLTPSGFYDDLSEYVVKHMMKVGDDTNSQLVSDNVLTKNLYNIVNNIYESSFVDMGVQTIKLYSYKNINSSNFSNLTQYNKFIAFCDDAKDKGYNYVICVKDYDDAKWYCALKGNLYRRSATGQFGLCSDSGTVNLPEYWYRDSNSSSGMGTVTNDGSNYYELGAPSIVFYKSWYTGLFPTTFWTFNGGTQKGAYLFSLTDSAQDYKVFTSLSAWINSKGHFEIPFIMPSYVAPSVSYSSNDMVVTYYNMSQGGNWSSMGGITTNTDGSINDSYNNIYNYYITNNGGSGGSGSGSGSDDKESLWDKIKDSVGDFFKSIAEVIEGLVGLVVDTVVKTLTSLVNGFNSILTTMKDFFLGGEETEGFFDIMSGFFDWLPEPLPLMLKSIFTLACVFALIKMIKGLAS